MELLSQGISKSSSDLARGMAACKAVVPFQERVEALLFSAREDVRGAQVRAALCEAAELYSQLTKCYNELVAFQREASGSQGSGSRFANLELGDGSRPLVGL